MHLGNEITENLHGSTQDKDIRHDKDVFVSPQSSRPLPKRPTQSIYSTHQKGTTRPHIFKGRFQNSRKPTKPPSLGLSSSLFRGNTGKTNNI